MEQRSRRLLPLGFLLLTAGFFLHPLLGGSPPAPPPARPATTASKPAVTTVRVRTADEFVNAIASDRIIELEEGDYTLTDVQERHLDHVIWNQQFDGKSLIIRNITNLKIVGVGKTPSHLMVKPRYVYVLGLDGCDGIVLENLKLGHAPDKGACACGVVGITSSKNVTIKKCDLYGSGTEGLTLEKSQDITLDESVIRDCSSGILTAADCKNITFGKNQFHDNQDDWGLEFNHCEKIVLFECLLENNRTAADAPLISATSSSDITLKSCTIKKNTAHALADPADKAVTVTECTQEENSYPDENNTPKK